LKTKGEDSRRGGGPNGVEGTREIRGRRGIAGEIGGMRGRNEREEILQRVSVDNWRRRGAVRMSGAVGASVEIKGRAN